MRKEIFTAVAGRIAEQVPEIQYIDLWNEQLAETTTATAFPTPSLFVEFEQYELVQNANHVTQADIGLCIHIVTRTVTCNGTADSRMQQALGFLDLIDRVNGALVSLSGDGFSTLMHTMSVTNHNHAELLESVERYVTRGIDTSAIRRSGRVCLSDLEILDRI